MRHPGKPTRTETTPQAELLGIVGRRGQWAYS
jgi:hypothetical protein